MAKSKKESSPEQLNGLRRQIHEWRQNRMSRDTKTDPRLATRIDPRIASPFSFPKTVRCLTSLVAKLLLGSACRKPLFARGSTPRPLASLRDLSCVSGRRA